MPVTTIPYRCQFCQRDRVFECDMPDNPLEPRFDINKMRPLLACDRCADHETDRRGIERKLVSVAGWLVDWRAETKRIEDTSIDQKRVHNARARLAGVEETAKAYLENLTRRWCHSVCKFRHCADFWDQEFPQALLDKPENTKRYLKFVRTRHVPQTVEGVPS